jgi:UDP-glucose:(heptosyl)LPS alpha-1,3-glucosyltransferase
VKTINVQESPTRGLTRGPNLPHRLRPEKVILVPPDATISGHASKRLRIAIVSPEVGSGAGVPHYWLALAQALSREHEVHVFTSKTDRPDLDEVEFHMLRNLNLGWFLSHLTFFIAAWARFAVAPQRRPFDLILGIGALTPFAHVATVHFVQARELDLARLGCFPRERPRTGLAGLDYALYGRSMSWLGRRFYRSTKTMILAISEGVKQDLAQLEGARLSATAVVPDGVDVQRFSPQHRDRDRDVTRKELGLTDKDKAVLFVGNSWGRKGLSTAIEAISGPGQAETHLIVVGQGRRSAFTENLPAELTERIVFAGSHGADVERFYAAADVFILPTLYEPFGLVILEALACGVPSIVSASAGAAEWLEDGDNVVLLQNPSDGAEARTALLSITSDPAFAAKLATNGRKVAEALEWSAIANQILAASASLRAVVSSK